MSEDYRCINCGMEFSQPKRVLDNPSGVAGQEEGYSVCPCCGSECFEKTVLCRVCGIRAAVNGDELALCPDCKRASLELFRLMLGSYFSREEVMYLSRELDGRDLCDGVEFSYEGRR